MHENNIIFHGEIDDESSYACHGATSSGGSNFLHLDVLSKTPFSVYSTLKYYSAFSLWSTIISTFLAERVLSFLPRKSEMNWISIFLIVLLLLYFADIFSLHYLKLLSNSQLNDDTWSWFPSVFEVPSSFIDWLQIGLKLMYENIEVNYSDEWFPFICSFHQS